MAIYIYSPAITRMWLRTETFPFGLMSKTIHSQSTRDCALVTMRNSARRRMRMPPRHPPGPPPRAAASPSAARALRETVPIQVPPPLQESSALRQMPPSRQERRQEERDATKRAPATAGAAGAAAALANLRVSPGGDWSTQAADPFIGAGGYKLADFALLATSVIHSRDERRLTVQ
jgi:hypothetical protein